jgi:hypothetical protein
VGPKIGVYGLHKLYEKILIVIWLDRDWWLFSNRLLVTLLILSLIFLLFHQLLHFIQLVNLLLLRLTSFSIFLHDQLAIVEEIALHVLLQ